MNRVCSWIFALAILAFAHASVVTAQDAASARPSDLDDRARIHFQAGTDYFERGDYEGALRELQIAHEMSGRPALLYNIGACLERLGRLTEAADQLEAYVVATNPEDAAAIRERALRLRARAEASSTTSSAGPSDDASQPPVVVDASDAGVNAVSPAAPGRTPHLASWITLGVGGVALVTFGVLGGLALAEDASLADRCGTSCSRGDVSSLEALSIAADVSLSVGLVLVAAGVVLALTTDESPSDEAARLELGPTGPRLRF
ncbi:MAG: tetratricopeptide repeat protein [Deltaproteobacteria bacterium]|nr:tetratricopeptide repeat protein [Deltaproteobacteria bacterium]